MKPNGVSPDEVIYNSIISCYGKIGDVQKMEQVIYNSLLIVMERLEMFKRWSKQSMI